MVVVVVLRSHVVAALLVGIAWVGLVGLVVTVDDGVIVVVVLWILLVRDDQVAIRIIGNDHISVHQGFLLHRPQPAAKDARGNDRNEKEEPEDVGSNHQSIARGINESARPRAVGR